MKSLTAFLLVLTRELGERCHVCTSRDLKTITARSEHEGLSFLTITLPKYGKALQRGLDQGFLAPSDVTYFKWHHGLPVFLQGFLELVFDRNTGRLLDNPDTVAISSLHQITSAMGKIKLPCSDERVAAAFSKYVECENDLKKANPFPSETYRLRFERLASVLWGDVLSAADKAVYDGTIIPRHGPGTTADRLLGNSKYNQQSWPERLETWFPFGEFVLPSWRHFNDADPHFVEPGLETPVKVVAIPKTLTTPRLIGKEPTCTQYVQQGILEVMRAALKQDDLCFSLVGTESQVPNQDLAREGSITGLLATLDLSEASDRVSNQHVRSLLSHYPSLLAGVDACRSRKADVPGHGIIRLSKFASMGSALTFDFEAMVFTTIIFLAIEDVLNRPLSRRMIYSYVGKVRVYGDDIIIPVEFVEPVVALLTSFGMVVNASKSFWTGRFRESCGGDFYDGTWITPVRVRQDFPTSLGQIDEVVSTVSLRNQLFEAGYVESVEWLDRILRKVLPVYPVVPRQSSALGRWSWGPCDPTGIDSDLQCPVIRAMVVRHRPRPSRVDGIGALTKFFLKRGVKPREDRKHLLFAGRPLSSDIIMGCVPTD